MDAATFRHVMNEGHSAAWDQDWRQAALHYRQAVHLDPANLQAVSHLAGALFELREYPEALHHYQRLASVDSQDPLALVRIAEILDARGNPKAGAKAAVLAAELYNKNDDPDRAMENWMRAVNLDPDNLTARARLAAAYEGQKRLQQAVNQYLVIASLFQHAGNKPRALQVVQYALQLVPDSKESNQALGLLRANQALPRPPRNPPRRTSAPEKGLAPVLPDAINPPLQLDPIEEAESRALSALAAIVFDQAEDPKDGGQQAGGQRAGGPVITLGTGPLNRVEKEQFTILLHVSQAVDLQSHGLAHQAAEELERAIQAGLDHAAAYFSLGFLKEGEARLESALRALQTSVKNPDYALASRLLIGKIFHQLNRTHDASLQYLEALRLVDTAALPPAKASALDQLYEPLIDAFAREATPAAQEEIIASVHTLLWQPDWRGRIARARHQLPESSNGGAPVPLAEILTQAQSSKVVEMLAKIHQLARSGQYRIAMEEAFYALQYAPNYLPLHTFMGDILAQQDRQPDAVTKLATVARAYGVRGEAARAIDIYRKISEIAPLDLDARQQLVDLLIASARIEEAVHETLDLGDIHYRLADLDEARRTYLRALTLAQQHDLRRDWVVDILHHLADIDMQRLDWSQALKVFEQIVRIDPLDEKAVLNLIELHFHLGAETEALILMGNFVATLNGQGKAVPVVEALEKLAQNNPDQIAIKQTLAEQYRRMGRTVEATRAWDEVGDLLAELGDIQGAIQAVRSILALNPVNRADYEEVMRRLRARTV